MELTNEEIQITGKNTAHITDDERHILDYECSPKSVARLVNSVKNKASWKQTAAMFNVINNCDILPFGAAEAVAEQTQEPQSRLTQATTKKAKSKKKRKMSGWNCYLKKCSEGGMSFPECMSDKPRKSQEYEPKKDYWKELAEKGC